MNELYTVTDFIIKRFQLNPLVNTISFEKTADMDLNKENIYPLVNIDYTLSTPTEEVIYFVYQISIVQQRDIDNELNNDKLFGSNMIDNLNETMSIAVKFINNIRNNHNDDDIFIENITDVTPLKLQRGNMVDGQQFTITLGIANNTPCL